MSQRLSRHSKNNTDFVSLNTGSNNTLHSRGSDPVIQTPQKATGDIKPESELTGLAKASPNFKKIEAVEPKDKTEEKKVLAKNSIPVEKPNSEKDPLDD